MSMNLSAAPANDRLSFAFIIVTAIHGVLILGVTFSPSVPDFSKNILEVTIARQETKEAPEEADYLAQANQEGSGTLYEKAELSTTELSDFIDNKINDIQKTQHSTFQKKQEINQKDIVASIQNQKYKVLKSDLEDRRARKNSQTEETMSIAERSKEIASLEAQLEERRQSMAKRPRRRQLTSVSTRASVDAAYMDAWRRKIELVGNLNFPKVGAYGALTLLVGIRSNGTIERIEIRRSSGNPKLDDAAVRIVRKASPYDPFPEVLKKQTDILEIIRTWKFEQGRVTSSSE